MKHTKERPILFSAPMVRAILDGRKSVTRRVVKPQPQDRIYRPCMDTENHWAGFTESVISGRIWHCPCGLPGDRLWVREAFNRGIDEHEREYITYEADGESRQIGLDTATMSEFLLDGDTDEAPLDGKKKPSIHMPRWASRITLEVVRVWVERLQEISRDDVVAEGVKQPFIEHAGMSHADCRDRMREEYGKLWESINGPGSWASNPWVWVISFNRIGGAA